MSELIVMIAIVVVILILGRLTTWPTIRHLRRQLADATWWLGYDELTGLPNRTGLQAARLAAKDATQPCILLLIDLDHFKTINDTYGHDIGDSLLIAVAEQIDETARVHGGLAARLSGDEFAALLPIRGTEFGRLADLFLATIATPVIVDVDGQQVTVSITASIGACWTEPTDLLDDGLRHADNAMYHAKANGGNACTFYEPGMAMPSGRPRRGPRLRDLRHRTPQARA